MRWRAGDGRMTYIDAVHHARRRVSIASRRGEEARTGLRVGGRRGRSAWAMPGVKGTYTYVGMSVEKRRRYERGDAQFLDTLLALESLAA